MESQFEVTVSGQFMYGSKSDTKSKNFMEVFVVPFKDGEALSHIQNTLIVERLRSKCDDFKRVRTCGIVNQKPVGKEITPLEASAAIKNGAEVVVSVAHTAKTKKAPLKTAPATKAAAKGKGSKSKTKGEFSDEV